MKSSRFTLRPLAIAIPAMLLCAAVCLPAQAADNTVESSAATSRQYDIPGGSLAESLSHFAAAAGVTLAFDAGQLSGLRSPGLRGQYTVSAGFARLLAGSGYEALPTGGQRYSLRRLPTTGETSLQPVTVTASGTTGGGLPSAYAGGQVAAGGRLGLLGNTHFMETPFNQTSYTAEAIAEQQARSLSDLLVNDPSVRQSSARTNINEDFSIRGFTVSSADVAVSGLYGLMPHFRVPVEMAERVEVLKGPSALLNGMPPSGNVGGAINIVPKRAANEPLTRLTASHVGEGIFGIHADIGRRFGETKEFGVRVNAAYRDGDTTIDKQTQKDEVYSLALDYQGERLRATLDVIYQDQDIDHVVRQFTATPTLTAMPKAPDNKLNYPGSGYSRADDKAVIGRIEYDLSDNISAYGGFGTHEHNLDALAGNPMLQNSAGDFAYSPAWQIFRVKSKSGEIGADARFKTGQVGHKLSLNYSRIRQDQSIDFDTFFAARTSNIFNPVYTATPDTGAATVKLLKYKTATLESHAIADTLAFFDERVKLTLGLRHQRVAQQALLFSADTRPYKQTKNTPAIGIVYQPQQNLSFYANYIEALSPGASSLATIPPTTLPPMVTKQIEIGSKIDWGKFATTVSLYQIKRPNAVLFGGVLEENGEQRNRGLELSIFGEVTRDVRLLGGLTLMDGKLTKTAGGLYDGNKALAVPRIQANLGVDWDNSLAPGLGLNARIVHTGRQYVDQANLLDLPAWTRIDIGARYKTQLAGKPLTLRVNVENLFDKNYWASSNEGYIYIGTPRTLLISGTVDF